LGGHETPVLGLINPIIWFFKNSKKMIRFPFLMYYSYFSGSGFEPAHIFVHGAGKGRI
jgi:hypothetical protein